MSVWTLEQVNAVRQMYARVEVDVRFRDAVHSGAARTIQAMAQTWAVEPDAQDVRLVHEEPRPEQAKVIETWAWMPDVRTVRILGGRSDGDEWEVHDIDQPIRFVSYTQVAGADPAPPPASDVTLRLAGWNEDDRVWIFAEG